jgi:putative ABC transport system permease protein
VLGLGVAGFAALLLAVSSDLLGLIAVGGFAAAVLLFAGLAGWPCSCCAARERGHGAALAGAGHAPGLGAPGLCRGAGQQPGRGPAGPGAAGAAAHRPDRSWRQATPPDAPNRFVINVSPTRPRTFSALQAGVAATTGTP